MKKMLMLLSFFAVVSCGGEPPATSEGEISNVSTVATESEALTAQLQC